jgi:hypothetical protein
MRLSDHPGLARLEGPRHRFTSKHVRKAATDTDIQKCQTAREDAAPQVREVQAILSRSCVSPADQARIFDLMAELGLKFEPKQPAVVES